MPKFTIEYDFIKQEIEGVYETTIEAQDEDHAKKIFDGLGPHPTLTKKISNVFGGQKELRVVRRVEVKS
jgi:hypothetical protein